MDDLRVESYNPNDVEEKKKLIKKRVALAGGVIVLTLGLFSLTGCDDSRRLTEQPTQVTEEEQIFWRLGGSGSWFTSVLERSA